MKHILSSHLGTRALFVKKVSRNKGRRRFKQQQKKRFPNGRQIVVSVWNVHKILHIVTASR